jgi:AcrR family transcriptional regulator
VTRRTFSRHFPDKREVLFSLSGSVTDLPETALVEGIARADGNLMPLQMIASAIAGYDWDALSPRPLQRKRHTVIMANPELMERELIKYEAIALAFAETLPQIPMALDTQARSIRVVPRDLPVRGPRRG